MTKHFRDEVMEQIQALSNQRYELYQAKWAIRKKPGYRERIKALDKKIADLWHDHRCELAREARPRLIASDSRGEYRSSVEAAVAHALVEDYELEPVTDPDALRDLVGGELVREVLAELRRDSRKNAPLSKLLKLRDQTLDFYEMGNGRMRSALKSLHT